MRYWLLQKKNFFSSFLAYLISKHYIENSIVLIKITLDNWLIGYGKNIFFLLRTFNPLHPNISMYILLTVI